MVSAVSAPTRLRVPDLLHAVDQAADGVLSGRYDHLLPADGLPADDRWYTRIHGDDELDIWLISWVKDHATELHDHGGSLLGALTLVSGASTNSAGTVRRCGGVGSAQATRRRSRWRVHDVVWARHRASPSPDLR